MSQEEALIENEWTNVFCVYLNSLYIIKKMHFCICIFNIDFSFETFYIISQFDLFVEKSWHVKQLKKS